MTQNHSTTFNVVFNTIITILNIIFLHLTKTIEQEIRNIVKTGISGGKKTKAGKSYRANSQVNRWNKEAGHKKFDSEVVQDFPAGPNARDAALKAEIENADRLRVLDQLKNQDYHKIP